MGGRKACLIASASAPTPESTPKIPREANFFEVVIQPLLKSESLFDRADEVGSEIPKASTAARTERPYRPTAVGLAYLRLPITARVDDSIN